MCSAVAEPLCVEHQAAAALKTEIPPTSTGASRTSRDEEDVGEDPSNPEWCFAEGNLPSPHRAQTRHRYLMHCSVRATRLHVRICVWHGRQPLVEDVVVCTACTLTVVCPPCPYLPPSHRHFVLFSMRLGCTCSCHSHRRKLAARGNVLTLVRMAKGGKGNTSPPGDWKRRTVTPAGLRSFCMTQGDVSPFAPLGGGNP